MDFSERILFVDDDSQIRKAFQRAFGRRGFSIDLASDAASALELARERDYAVVATDYRMPGVNGLQLADQLKTLQPDATYMLISGNADLALTLDAVNEHALSYVIPKPWDSEALTSSLRRAVETSWEKKGHRRVAASMVNSTRLLRNKEEQLRAALEAAESNVSDALLGSLELRDRQTQRACRRVAASARILAEAMGLSPERVVDVERGALLHDIGKIGIPDSILLKEGPLTEGEWNIMRTHTTIGAKLVQEIPSLAGAKKIIEQHHERWEGGGYPRDLVKDEICLGARILSVIDTLDAIMSDRPYRKGAPYAVAREEIMRCSGTQFDPEVVRIFLTIPEERWLDVRRQFPDEPSAAAA